MVDNCSAGRRSWSNRGRLLTAAVLFALVGLGSPSTGSASFAPVVSFPVGTDPLSVTIGNLNGDGFADLVTANFSSSDISALPGTGTGSFGSAINSATSLSPDEVAIGKLNGDGILDIAVTNSSNVAVQLGLGTGSFAAPNNFAAGGGPSSVAIGTLDGGGFADLAVTKFFSDNVSVVLGDGTGSFGTAATFPVGDAPVSVGTGNLNGDSFADLAVANLGSDNVSILLGNGSGSFGAATNFATGDEPSSIAFGDLNGDGFTDLTTANKSSDNVSVLLGTGTGSFGTATNFPAGDGPVSIAIGNLDGGSTPDLAVANIESDNVSILPGNGSGSFGVATNFAVGEDPNSIAVGNLNGDGNPDLAVSNFVPDTVSVLLNTNPTAAANPVSLNFQPQERSSTSAARTVTITNSTGGEPMFVSGVTVTGNNPGEFEVISETCTAAPIAFSGTCQVKVTFKPSALGSRTAKLEVDYNGGTSPLTVPLTGTGAKARIGRVTVTGPATLRKGKPTAFKVKVTNSGNSAATGVRLVVSGRGMRFNAPVGRINAGATRTVNLRIRPSRTGRIKATFKVVSSNAGSKAVSKTVRVR